MIRNTVHPKDAQDVPYIGLEHIAEGQLALTGYGSANEVTSIKSRFRRGDILFGKLRPYFRKVIIAPFDGVCSTDIWVIRAKQGIDQRFLFYWIASREFIDEATSASEGTKMPRAQWEFVQRIEKPIPYLKEQQAIAHILGTLDDKIELNRQMNQTLEAIARAIFKSWFVDFDPVRAKMNSPSPDGRGVRGEGIRPAIHTNTPIPTDILDFARQMRRQATDAEALLWRLLRGRRIANAKFRRQHFFPPYILDFYCHELKLAVELDGGQHNLEADQRRDARRDAYLAEHGIQVLRFWNNDVLRETEAVLEAIYAAVVERVNAVPSPPAPLPGGEGSCPQHILDLFPDRLVDSELGQIPEGWEVGILGNLSHKPQYGYTASANDEPVGPKFLRITDINKMSWIEWSSVPHCKISDKEFEQYRLREGDILIARMADPGHGVMIEEDIEAVFASYLIRLPLRDSIYKRFIQYWLRSNSYWV